LKVVPINVNYCVFGSRHISHPEPLGDVPPNIYRLIINCMQWSFTRIQLK
jgi:hypothetical protein